MVFLTFLGFSLRVHLDNVLHMSMGLDFLFSQFPLLSSAGCLITGMVVVVNVTSTTITQRLQELGVMKSIGLLEEVATFFLIEVFLLAGIGCAIGGTVGFLACLGLQTLMTTLSVAWSAFWLWLIFLMVVVIGFFVFFFSMYYPIYRFITHQGIINISGVNTSGFIAFLGRLKLRYVVKIPLKAIVFHKHETTRVIGSIVCCSAIIAFSIVGSQIVTLSAEHYVTQAIGQHTYLIGAPDVTERYIAQLDFHDSPVQSFNYLLPEYRIDSSLIDWLTSQTSIRQVDARIIMETIVSEVKYVEPLPPNDYRVVGSDRAVSAVVMGIHPEYVVSDWIHLGQLNVRSGNSVWVGDSMLEILADYQCEKLIVLNEAFSISGVCLDPVNNGYTVYMSYASLSELLDSVDANLLFIEMNATTSSLEQKIQEYGLTLVDLTEVLNDVSRFFRELQSTVLSIPILMTISLAITLGSYLTTIILGMRSDYKTMYAIGMSGSKIKTTILIQSVLLIVPWFFVGILLGTYFSYNVLVPFPQLPSQTTMYINLLVLGFIPTLLVAGESLLSLKLLSPVVST